MAACEGDRQLKVICADLSLAGQIEFGLLFFFFFSNCSHKQNDRQINHKWREIFDFDFWDFSAGHTRPLLALSPALMAGNAL